MRQVNRRVGFKPFTFASGTFWARARGNKADANLFLDSIEPLEIALLDAPTSTYRDITPTHSAQAIANAAPAVIRCFFVNDVFIVNPLAMSVNRFGYVRPYPSLSFSRMIHSRM